jgi:hypothetical protein
MKRLLGIWMTAALVCAAVMVCAPAVADAQGYSVYADCNRADGWQASASNGNWAAYNDCGGWRPGMKAYVVPHNDARTDTGGAYWSFAAPAGTRINGLHWGGYKYHGWTSGGWLGGGWLFRTSVFGDGFRPIDGEGICDEKTIGVTNACYSGAAGDPSPKAVGGHYVGGLNDGIVGFGVSCVPSPNPCATNSDGQNSHGYTRAALAVQNMRVDLTDQWDPSIKAVGGSVTTGGWKRGAVDLTVTADDNSGICALSASAGGQRQEATRSRDSFAVKQCGDLKGDRFTWDTSGWSDGAHTAAVWVSDAAGRGASWGWHTFHVDNNAPAAPSNLSIDGGE